ncbi:hypothetical protein LTR53_003266 [Teratosphaeriaceae sp. CCFEE 6253]|nr:hypothetical protein LTR53_003266 [Teratosphaeriaceae sp. CCFEE 6253]
MSHAPMITGNLTPEASSTVEQEAEERGSRNRPASSPPLVPADAIKPSRERSHEDKATEQGIIYDEMEDEVDVTPSQLKLSSSQIDVPAKKLPSSAAHTSMLPPPAARAPTIMPPPSFRPPQSGQGSQGFATSQTHPLQSQQELNSPIQHDADAVDSEATIPDHIESDDMDVPVDPQDKIVEFDWTDLEQRYYAKMSELNGKEMAIWTEFDRLCNAGLHLLAETSTLKTQAIFVQHKEDELEQNRGHYIKVVEAFKSALSLLGN